jgi:hypothetical protein
MLAMEDLYIRVHTIYEYRKEAYPSKEAHIANKCVCRPDRAPVEFVNNHRHSLMVVTFSPTHIRRKRMSEEHQIEIPPMA